MRILKGEQEVEAKKVLLDCVEVAKQAMCERSKCGSIIIDLDGEVIGAGFNSPPNGSKSRCSIKKDTYDLKVTDKTCCIHAEQRAIMSAIKYGGSKIYGSRLYFVRIDENNQPKMSGDPYCTICSKMALDAGISEFVLWREEGICVYNTEVYNELSFKYNK